MSDLEGHRQGISTHTSIHPHRGASWNQVNPRDCKPQGKGRTQKGKREKGAWEIITEKTKWTAKQGSG